MRDVRQNKGSILRASVEYIRLLKEDLTAKLQLDKLCRLQQYQNRKLLNQIQASVTHAHTVGTSIRSSVTHAQ